MLKARDGDWPVNYAAFFVCPARDAAAGAGVDRVIIILRSIERHQRALFKWCAGSHILGMHFSCGMAKEPFLC